MLAPVDALKCKPRAKPSLGDTEAPLHEFSKPEAVFRHTQCIAAVTRLVADTAGTIVVGRMLVGMIAASLPHPREQSFESWIVVVIAVILLVLGIGFILRELRSIVFSYEIGHDVRLRTICGWRTVRMSSVSRIDECHPGEVRSFRLQSNRLILELYLCDSEKITLYVPSCGMLTVLAYLRSQINESNRRNQVLSNWSICGLLFFGSIVFCLGAALIMSVWQHDLPLSPGDWQGLILLHIPAPIGVAVLSYALYAWRRRRRIWLRI